LQDAAASWNRDRIETRNELVCSDSP